MERGVVIGGILISASFLLAVLLNSSAELAADAAGTKEPSAPPQPAARDNPGFYAGEAGLNPPERAGREIPDNEQNACWCEPQRDGRCWQRSTRTESAVHHILKGGEDSIGSLEATH